MTAPSESREGGKDEVTALARGLALVRLVSDSPTALSNRDLVDATGIPKATVSRLAATLVAAGFLRQLPQSDRFVLGGGVLEMGNAWLRNFDWRSHARPYLQVLANQANAAVHLMVNTGLDQVIIDSLRSKQAVILSRLDVGSRMAVATSAAGRAYLASLEPAAREVLLDEIRAASGDQWADLAPRIEQALKDYERQGFCSSFGEWHPEINALGFTLKGPRGELYAVSCGGPAYLLSPDYMLETVGPLIAPTIKVIASAS
ncbi:MAG: IclR family transcriptional regulator [Ramlibacter sp.]|nr:IclR family transcriptional regulator [Ramlibacter sp.]